MASWSANAVPELHEGVFAINKPPGISSAQVIRDVQSHFKSSALFQPWLQREQDRKDAESHNQRRKRRSWKQRQPMQVKMGHGGTLDPMATGVLILGVGNGTKHLASFLECTKSYETVVLFGVATDSYDSVGKQIAHKPYQHVTKEIVEKALGSFRGKIMQKPPIFSALKVQGKKLYEYAREGKEVPVEIQERELDVESLELTEWMSGGTHEYSWPAEAAEPEEGAAAEKTLQLSKGLGADLSSDLTQGGGKRKRSDTDGDATTSPKRSKSSPPPAQRESRQTSPVPIVNGDSSQQTVGTKQQSQACPAPACRVRMTVSSGFYVRSLCHDLGTAVGSLGLMASLVRTRQGDFVLGQNVLEYDELAKGEDVWGPRVRAMLETWNTQNPVGRPDSPEEVGGDVQHPRRARRPSGRPQGVGNAGPRRNSSSDEG